ncbi:hypothetical protein K2173_020029 [Erythroxylum novogranatense]|uniref:Exoribonuclease phosphorolytic domain-containing protein n=1 Tax=Erythroxylum novogranatense TaxID=1862640 RepID=A0AAV8U9M3_9ROSI|nr:hypothetical protein K2173_020029 [Erythroxylum novogranatense]
MALWLCAQLRGLYHFPSGSLGHLDWFANCMGTGPTSSAGRISAVFEMGNTKVLAAVNGPREIDIYVQVLQTDGDLNYVEDSAGGPDVTVGLLPKLDKVTLLQMDAKLPIDIFENVMQLAVEGCKAVANYIRENTKQLEYRRGQ